MNNSMDIESGSSTRDSTNPSSRDERLTPGQPPRGQKTFVTPIPKKCYYDKVLPLGFKTELSYRTFTPKQTTGQLLANGDSFTIPLTGSEGYWIPELAYMDIVIDVTQNPQIQLELRNGAPLGFIMQVDGSAQNMFETVMYEHNISGEIEKWINADVLWSVLTDMEYSPNERAEQLAFGAGSILSPSFSAQSNMIIGSTNNSTNNAAMMNWNPRGAYNGVNAVQSSGPTPTQVATFFTGVVYIIGEGSQTITFPIPFLTLPTVLAQYIGGTPPNPGNQAAVQSVSLTGAIITSNNNNATSITAPIQWFAIQTTAGGSSGYNGIQAGFSGPFPVTIPATTTQITFPTAFSALPIVTASVGWQTVASPVNVPTGSVYSVVISNISNTGFSWAINNQGTLPTPVSIGINWVAMAPTTSTAVQTNGIEAGYVTDSTTVNAPVAITFNPMFQPNSPPFIFTSYAVAYVTNPVTPSQSTVLQVLDISPSMAIVETSNTTTTGLTAITWIAVPTSSQSGTTTAAAYQYVQVQSGAAILATQDSSLCLQPLLGQSSGTFTPIYSNQGTSSQGIWGSTGTTAPLLNYGQTTTAIVGAGFSPDSYGYGVQRMFADNFSMGNEARFSAANLIPCIVNGQPTVTSVLQRQFKIPLPSALLGPLNKCGKLLPMTSIDNSEFRFTPSQYWLFCSTPSTSQYARSYALLKINIHAIIVRIMECVTNTAIQSQLDCDGIWFVCKSWMFMGAQQIAPGQPPPQSQNITYQFLSLLGICWVFIPEDYKQSILCRRNYRISMCVQSAQFGYDTRTIPERNPVVGMAGTNAGYPSNDEFLLNLYRLFNKDPCNIDRCSVNRANFSVNTREFDPNLLVGTNLVYTLPGPFSATTPTTQNLTGDTSFIMENRTIGKPVYGLKLAAFDGGPKLLAGLDTTCVKNMYLLQSGTQNGNFPRLVTMHVFAYFNVMFLFHRNKIRRIYA